MKTPSRRRMCIDITLEVRRPEVPGLERARVLALIGFIQGWIPLIEKLFRDLGGPGLKDGGQEELTMVGCRLEDLYSAFESLFKRISTDFPLFGTRRSVLEKMRMDLPARPAVVEGEVFETLVALARFRRRFRQRYEHPLEAREVEPVLNKALELRAIYRPQIEAFLEFLRRVR